MSLEHRSNEQVRAILGARLRSVRKSRGATQTELGERAGLSRPTVSALERGQDVNLDTFLSVLRSLDLLDSLDIAVAEPGISPMAELKRQRNVTPPPSDTQTWQWGDEQ